MKQKKRTVSVHALLIALAVPVVALAAVAVLALFLLRGADFHAVHQLSDITDEDLRSGSSSFQKTMWAGEMRSGRYRAQWRSMTGWDSFAVLSLSDEAGCTLIYTVEDPGAGYRLVLSAPDGTLTDLEPGENPLFLPTGETRVILAACETGGAFSLELAPGSPGTLTLSSDP